MLLDRRDFLKIAAGSLAMGAAASGCLPPLFEWTTAGLGPYRLGIASPGLRGQRYPDPRRFRFDDDRVARIRGATRRAVSLVLPDGLGSLVRGKRVLVKPAHDTDRPFPFSASPIATSEIVRMCVQAGALKVVVADCVSLEHGLRAGEDPQGSSFLGTGRDATIRAFRESGMARAIEELAAELALPLEEDSSFVDDPGRRGLQLTSFRQHGWRRHYLDEHGVYEPRSSTPWVQAQVRRGTESEGQTLSGDLVSWRALGREFDAERGPVPGMWVPVLFDKVDLVINVFRVSTHVLLGATLSIANFIGTERPDDRLWMHQTNFVKGARSVGANDPLASDMPFQEILAELHLPARRLERLAVADASVVVTDGGPDECSTDPYPADVILAASDPVSADVAGLSILRAAMAAGRPCEPLDRTVRFVELGSPRVRIFDIGRQRGADERLCDRGFSSWDWVAIQRARELGLGPRNPEQLATSFDDGEFAVSESTRLFMETDIGRAPTRPILALPSRYPGALFAPAHRRNFEVGREGAAVDVVVIHTAQGSYRGTIAWFSDSRSHVSTHFVVRSADGEITQMVEESDTGHHAGNPLYEDGRPVMIGVDQRSIGIEHEGYQEDPERWYTEAMYRASAGLVRYLALKYAIPIDRQHIIGHNEVPNPRDPSRFGGRSGHIDPGPGWDWDLYMRFILDGF